MLIRETVFHINRIFRKVVFYVHNGGSGESSGKLTLEKNKNKMTKDVDNLIEQ